MTNRRDKRKTVSLPVSPRRVHGAAATNGIRNLNELILGGGDPRLPPIASGIVLTHTNASSQNVKRDLT